MGIGGKMAHRKGTVLPRVLHHDAVVKSLLQDAWVLGFETNDANMLLCARCDLSAVHPS